VTCRSLFLVSIPAITGKTE